MIAELLERAVEVGCTVAPGCLKAGSTTDPPAARSASTKAPIGGGIGRRGEIDVEGDVADPCAFEPVQQFGVQAARPGPDADLFDRGRVDRDDDDVAAGRRATARRSADRSARCEGRYASPTAARSPARSRPGYVAGSFSPCPRSPTRRGASIPRALPVTVAAVRCRCHYRCHCRCRSHCRSPFPLPLPLLASVPATVAIAVTVVAVAVAAADRRRDAVDAVAGLPASRRAVRRCRCRCRCRCRFRNC